VSIPTDTVHVQIANTTLHVPVLHDPKTTQALAARVHERILAIERQSNRIDTQAFAIQAALSFAHELEDLTEANRNDVRELMLSLDKIAETLRRLLDAISEASD